VTTRAEDALRDLTTLGSGLLLLAGWLTFASMAFSATFLFIPTAIGYGLLSRAPSIRERRVLWLMTVILAVFAVVLWAFMLWVATHQTVEINIQP
jgi:hypothetical protein